MSYQTTTLDGYQVKTPDGRQLSTQTYGDPDGKPVFLLHGTPGSRIGPHPRGTVLHRLGVRLIAFDRPGYGDSDRFEGRRVADAATDVLAIADAFDLDKFAVVGRSGGGPHALACAAKLPDRLTRAAVLVGLAPPVADGLDWYEGMTRATCLSTPRPRADTKAWPPGPRPPRTRSGPIRPACWPDCSRKCPIRIDAWWPIRVFAPCC